MSAKGPNDRLLGWWGHFWGQSLFISNISVRAKGAGGGGSPPRNNFFGQNGQNLCNKKKFSGKIFGQRRPKIRAKIFWRRLATFFLKIFLTFSGKQVPPPQVRSCPYAYDLEGIRHIVTGWPTIYATVSSKQLLRNRLKVTGGNNKQKLIYTKGSAECPPCLTRTGTRWRQRLGHGNQQVLREQTTSFFHREAGGAGAHSSLYE